MRGDALGYGEAGRYASCKRWQKQQSGYQLVFQDALGQQSGCFGAIAVALAAVGVRWVGEAEVWRTSG